MTFLSVTDLQVSFSTEDGTVKAVDGVSFNLERGKTLAIVGESGSGKSVTSQAIMALHTGRGTTVSGQIELNGTDIVTASEEKLRSMRGNEMAMIFQDPFASLHPFYRIGSQLAEAVYAHRKVSKKEAKAEALRMLNKVGIPNPEQRIEDYPHQLSGGMRQRVMIAMALINGPELLIADEPTTALDVTVQAQILELLAELQAEFNTAIILITHDLGIVADKADEIVVMYGGRIVEQAGLHDLFYKPQMPYTVGLLSSVPRLDSAGNRLLSIGGQPPSLINLPTGCVFNPRCAAKNPDIAPRCESERPELREVGENQFVRCHLDEEQREKFATTRLAEVLEGE